MEGLTGDGTSYTDSAEQLRAIVKSKLLKFTDLKENPQRFFAAHRALAERSPELGPGFFIRFTVQYNLFAGTILSLAGEDQLHVLDDIHERGELGCFALTEKLAGVNSGLVVNTTIDWDESSQTFCLSSPAGDANKNWISQGLVGDKACVVADLRVKGTSHGPHAFLMDLRRDGELVPGVTLEDMGRKTVGNDLDNARINFEDVSLPKSALLNRYADIEDNTYVQRVQGIRTMDMIGQRLFTGRIAVAQAAIEFNKRLYEMTKSYSDNKKCWAPNDLPSLSSIPHLAALYEEAAVRTGELESFVGSCEARLNTCLTEDVLPDTKLIEAIAVAKVKAVEDSIELCFRLKQEVGSYALMGGAGFEQMDFLQCCKFAEGDSRILMLKMARDRLRRFQKKGASGSPDQEQEESLCSDISDRVAASVAAGSDPAAALNDEWESLYTLAELTMQRTMRELV